LAEYNPFSPEIRANPYPTYKALREEDPVKWSDLMQAWILTGYDDIQTVLKDAARFSSDRRQANNRFVQAMQEAEEQASPMRRAPTMLNSDPPAHTRMRNLVNKAFTPRVVEKMRPHTQAITDELLDLAPEPGKLDVIADLATPLPVIMIAEMLGVSPKDRAQFKAWSNDIASTLGGPLQRPDIRERARASSFELADYFRKVIAERRDDPKDDLISALIAAEEQGDLLSEDELMATCILLLVAGNETTTNLIGNGTLALLRSPDQIRRLQEDPSLITSAVEELLRYDGPVQATSRVAMQDMKFRDKELERGQVLLTFLGAANHDPARFTDPERLDIGRLDNRHMAFGHGIHFCLGAPLARVEGQIALRTLLERYPEPRPEFDEPQWGNSFILRGLTSLPISSSKVAAAP
jgi:pimeloyl-[acyl-carrier protein] synthase